ncbi:PGN_0703 family putative restriction endonuclease [Geodermatophilus sp. SYSU D01180]
MTDSVISTVRSDDPVTRRERRRQSDFREQVLDLPAGTRKGQPLGNHLREEHGDHNFLSPEAARYARARAEVVRDEGGQLERSRLFTNMLSSMPLAFSVFGHLRAHRDEAATVLGHLLDLPVTGFDRVEVGKRVIDGIECEWAPAPHEHLGDGSAFDAVLAARLADGRSVLVAVETKYVDSFSRDPGPDKDRRRPEKDANYRRHCERFGMADGAFDRLGEYPTRQLLRNVLLTESVRRGGSAGGPVWEEEAVTLVLARDDDEGARDAVRRIDAGRGALPTRVLFRGHGDLVDAAAAVPELSDWAALFRRRYLP